jgi:hypothetical protein
MVDALDLGTYGAGAGAGTEDDTAFDILREMLRKNPRLSYKELRLAHWESVKDDEVALREIHRHWLQLSLRRLRKEGHLPFGVFDEEGASTNDEVSADGPNDPRSYQPPRKTATKRDYTAGIELHRNLLMNMYRINGKPLADCTGVEVKGAATEHKRHHQFLSRVAEGMDGAATVRDAYRGRERLIDEMMES